MTKAGKPLNTENLSQKHSLKMKISSLASKTTGGLVGINEGFLLGNITATERLAAELVWLKDMIALHHDDPQTRKAIEKRIGLISLMIFGGPVYFGLAPFYGAFRGAQVGAHAGFTHSFVDVPYEAVKLNKRVDKIPGVYHSNLPPTTFYKDRKNAREAKVAKKQQADTYFDIQETKQETKKARKCHSFFPSKKSSFVRLNESSEDSPLLETHCKR